MSKLRYEVVADEIRNILGDMTADTRLPGVRSLMERFNVSQATVDRSLEYLLKSGDVVRRPGNGYFRAVRQRKFGKRVALCFCYRRECMGNSLFGAMIADFLQRADIQGYELNVFAFDANSGMDNLRSRLENNTPECCVLLGCSNANLLYNLRDMRISCVQLYPNVIVEDTPTVLIDNQTVINLLMEHLVGLGHSRIAMLHGQGFNDTYMFDQEERMEAFYRAMRRYELPYSSRTMCYGGFDAETGYQAAKQLLDTAPELRPTAIVANDYNASGVYCAAAELGLRIPDDLSVTGIDNVSLCQSLSPALTSVDVEWDAAIELVIRLIETPGEEKILRMPVKLIPRGSIGKVPSE